MRNKKRKVFVYQPLDYQEYKKTFSFKYEFLDMHYNTIDFELDGQYTQYIKNIEKLVRSSIEYKVWTNMHQDIECIVTNFSKDETNEIELHHHPYTLFTITEKVANTLKNFYGIDLTSLPTFIVQNEVIKLHLLDLVMFVPMLRSYHRMYHENPWVIPQDKIRNGKLIVFWDSWFNEKITYENFIELCLQNKYQNSQK